MASKAKRIKRKIEIPKVSSIGKLPDDVLLEVFELLDGKALKEASMVCENWNKVISLNKATMKKLLLKYYDSDEKHIISSKRNWVSMRANLLYCNPEKFAKFIKKFGGNLEDLIVICDKNIPEEKLRTVLKNLPSIKSLELPGVTIESSLYVQTSPINLSHLSKLVLRVDTHVLQMISAPLLKSLEINFNKGAFEVRDLTAFLQTVPKLETLKYCRPNSFIESFKASKEGFPFKLKSLRCRDLLTNAQERDLCNFLLSQTLSLEEFGVPFESRACYEFLLKELKRLQIWRNDFLQKLPSDEQFYRQFKPTDIKEIIGYGSFPNETAAKGILGICPNLQVLEIPGDKIVPDMLPFLSTNNPKLKSLKLYHIGTAEARFPAMKTLSLKYFSKSELESFLGWNPTIENLTLKFDNSRNPNEDFSIITKYGIKSLDIEGDPDKMYDIYNIIKANSGSIVILKLFESCAYRILKFTFPVDQSEWSQDHKSFDLEAQVFLERQM